MKALRFSKFGPPSVLTIEEVPRPEPVDGEALIQVKAAGINPSDVKNVSGFFRGTKCVYYNYSHFSSLYFNFGASIITVIPGGTERVNQTFPPITEPAPITVSPPKIVAPA